MASGPPAAAISVSMLRVSAGPHSPVVVTTPRSVKIMVRLAPESSNARMSRRRETPVALKASTMSPRWRMRATMAAAAASLSRLHAIAGERDHRDAAHVERRPAGSSGAVADARRNCRCAPRGRGSSAPSRSPCSRMACPCPGSRSRRRRGRRPCSASESRRRGRGSTECGPNSRTAPCDAPARRPRCRPRATFAMRPLVSSGACCSWTCC